MRFRLSAEVRGLEENRENITTVDGVRAIEMRYRPIFDTDTKEPAFYQSSIRLNSAEMGVLLPERFMPVLESCDRCISVFKLALLQTIKAGEKFAERELDFGWISVFMPLWLLQRNYCISILNDFMSQIKADTSKICLEIPAVVVNEGNEHCFEAVKKLRKSGFHTMITGLDDSFSMFGLAELEPEYIMLDQRVTEGIGEDKRRDACIKSLISFIDDLDAYAVAAGVSSPNDADKLYDMNCPYYTVSENSGERGGSFMLERFVRRRTQE